MTCSKAKYKRLQYQHGKGGNVVAFVYDHLAVFRNEVLYFILSIQALNDRNVDAARPFRLPAADMSDRLGGQI